jgi:endonuclease III
VFDEESPEARRKRARVVLRLLRKTYPDATCALTYRNAFELLVATILSAQCTDAKVNEVTPTLFARYPDPPHLAAADQAELEDLIRPIGMYRRKSALIQGASQVLVERFGGEVPATMEELRELPGVARKSANVVLGTWFGIAEGIVVDTHVLRLSLRIGLSDRTDAEKIERDLMELYPRKDWIALGHTLTWHGRAICDAKRPQCGQCPVVPHCPRVGLDDRPRQSGEAGGAL